MRDDDSIRNSREISNRKNNTLSRVNFRYITCFLVIQITIKKYFFKFNRLWMMNKVGKIIKLTC
jgi:hypothetical protein